MGERTIKKNENIKKPIIVKFRKDDGNIIKVKAIKIKRKPIKINFHYKNKAYKE